MSRGLVPGPELTVEVGSIPVVNSSAVHARVDEGAPAKVDLGKSLVAPLCVASFWQTEQGRGTKNVRRSSVMCRGGQAYACNLYDKTVLAGSIIPFLRTDGTSNLRFVQWLNLHVEDFKPLWFTSASCDAEIYRSFGSFCVTAAQAIARVQEEQALTDETFVNAPAWNSTLCMTHWGMPELQRHLDPNGYVIYVNGR